MHFWSAPVRRSTLSTHHFRSTVWQGARRLRLGPSPCQPTPSGIFILVKVVKGYPECCHTSAGYYQEKDAGVSENGLADVILLVHALFVAGVVGCVPLILVGRFLRWRWVQNPGFRLGHLSMIGFVVFEVMVGMRCPLTVWEHRLRDHGQTPEAPGQDCIAYWVGHFLYHAYPPWVFSALYIGFGVVVLSLFYFVPVSWGTQSVRPRAIFGWPSRRPK